MKSAIVTLLIIAIGLTSCATFKIPKERNVTIQTKVNFKRHSLSAKDFYYTLEMGRGDGLRSVYWPDDAPKPSTLNKKISYSVELIEEEHKMTVGDTTISRWSAELLRLRDGKHLLYDASVCAVHNLQMERNAVPISYGFPLFEPEYLKAKNTQFPNTGMVLGGCCVNPDRPMTHAWVCKNCVTNKKMWEQINKAQMSDDLDPAGEARTINRVSDAQLSKLPKTISVDELKALWGPSESQPGPRFTYRSADHDDQFFWVYYKREDEKLVDSRWMVERIVRADRIEEGGVIVWPKGYVPRPESEIKLAY